MKEAAITGATAKSASNQDEHFRSPGRLSMTELTIRTQSCRTQPRASSNHRWPLLFRRSRSARSGARRAPTAARRFRSGRQTCPRRQTPSSRAAGRAHPRRAGDGPPRRRDPRDRAADPCRDDLHPRSRQPVRSGYVYGRADNETVREAEAVIAMLEEAPRPRWCSARACRRRRRVFLALTPGDHVVAPKVMYWALRNWLMTDARALGPRRRASSIRPTSTRRAPRSGRARRSWSGSRRRPTRSGRSPTSPALADDRPCGRAPGSRSISTVATPVLTRPLALGADIVMHAATK